MKYFGTDGIRGIVGRPPIEAGFASRLGGAMVRYLKNKGKQARVLCGIDTRESGKGLAEAIGEGICAQGGRLDQVGVITTPGLAFLARDLGYSLGVMVSASHNPWEYNGFKLFQSDGSKMNISDEEEIETLIDTQAIVTKGPCVDGLMDSIVARQKYMRFLVGCVDNIEGLKGISVGIDCANGSTSLIAPELFSSVCKNSNVIFYKPNGSNINKKCGSEYPDALSRLVIDKHANVGLCFDGDGDRIVAIDEKGYVLTGDHLLYIYARFLKDIGKMKRNLVVTTIMSNSGIKAALRKYNMATVETDVGDRNVYYKMVQEEAQIGGEESGHIIFRDYHTTGDGILSALKLLEAMAFYNVPLSELREGLTLFPKLLRNIKVLKKIPLEDIKGLQNALNKARAILGDEGKVVIRYSGTEPVLRVMVEAPERGLVEELMGQICNEIGPYALP